MCNPIAVFWAHENMKEDLSSENNFIDGDTVLEYISTVVANGVHECHVQDAANSYCEKY